MKHLICAFIVICLSTTISAQAGVVRFEVSSECARMKGRYNVVYSLAGDSVISRTLILEFPRRGLGYSVVAHAEFFWAHVATALRVTFNRQTSTILISDGGKEVKSNDPRFNYRGFITNTQKRLQDLRLQARKDLTSLYGQAALECAIERTRDFNLHFQVPHF